MKENHVLEVSNICKSFNGKKVINDISFKVEAGDVFGFLGPNGSGKTTAIRIILGLVHLDAGMVKINGYDIKKSFYKAIKHVGAIVENPSFHGYLSAYDNLMQIANLHPDVPVTRVNEILEYVGLKSRAKDIVKTYSLGMKQRLGIALALINEPTIVFLDEPTNGLDPQGIIEIRELITRLAEEQGITFFVTTHNLHEVEQVCNKVGILKMGRLIAQDYVTNLLYKDKEVINVYTDKTDQALKLLQNTQYVSSQEAVPYGFRIKLDKGFSGELNKLMVENNIKVDYIIPENQTLEQFFIELTGGENKDVGAY